mgnify:CR=1 FL=1
MSTISLVFFNLYNLDWQIKDQYYETWGKVAEAYVRGYPKVLDQARPKLKILWVAVRTYIGVFFLFNAYIFVSYDFKTISKILPDLQPLLPSMSIGLFFAIVIILYLFESSIVLYSKRFLEGKKF